MSLDFDSMSIKICTRSRSNYRSPPMMSTGPSYKIKNAKQRLPANPVDLYPELT